MFWIIFIALLIIFFLFGPVIFAWRNAKRSLRPNTISLENEIKWNKERGLWLDFDSYKTVPYEVKCKDGYIIHAMFVDNPDAKDTGRYVIICHGHTSNRYGAVKYANSYLKLGFNCIIFDARGHGENAPATCTLGEVESRDLMCVIEDAKSRYPDMKVLGLHGESMGSSTCLCAIRYDPPVDFIVSDCCFTRCYDIVKEGYGNLHMSFLAVIANAGAKVLYHVDLRDTCAIKYVENSKYPILFIHGAGDTFIKPHNSERLREAASKNGAYTELIFVEGAGHACSRYVAGFEAYTGYIENFLKKIGVL